MSLLAQLLKAKDPLFVLTLRQLEDITGRKGVDVALISEIIAKAHHGAQQLGLDPPDYSAEELYWALVNRVKKDDARLAKQLGGTSDDNIADIMSRIVHRVNGLDMERSGWFLKDGKARAMLKANPPKQVMKKLGYRGIESMLRRENLYELYGALRFVEESGWLNKFIEQYHQLTFGDFEQRDIRVIEYDWGKWGRDIASDFITKKLHNITHLKELGVIVVLPVHEDKMPGITMRDLLLLIHYHYEIRLYSAFFKLNAGKRDFGDIFVDTLIADPGHIELAGGQTIHWRVIARYFGKLPAAAHPEIFEPHVQPEDLHWRKAEEVLYDIDPEFEFWRDMDYVGVLVDQEPVTFNMLDVAFSYAAGGEFADRYLYHFRESLWNEIFVRYFSEQVLEEKILLKLDNQVIAPEEIRAGRRSRS